MLACSQDADEGFAEEEGKSKAEGMAPPLGLPAHFALEGTAEHSIVSSCSRLEDIAALGLYALVYRPRQNPYGKWLEIVTLLLLLSWAGAPRSES